MINHLKEAKELARVAEIETNDILADRYTQLAIAHALIAHCECMDKANESSTRLALLAQEEANWNAVGL